MFFGRYSLAVILILGFQALAACNGDENLQDKGPMGAGLTLSEPSLEGVPPLRLLLTPDKLTVSTGERIIFSVIGVYEKGKSKVLTSQLSFNSSAPEVFSADNTGLGVALKEGDATVTAQYLGVSSKSEMTVTPPRIGQLLIFPGEVNVQLKMHLKVPVPDTIKLRAYGLRTDGQMTELTQEAGWSLSPECGLEPVPEEASHYKASKAETCTIRANWGDFEAERKVIVGVEDRVLVDMRPTTNPLVVRIGETKTLNMVGFFSDQSEEPLTNFMIESNSSLFSFISPKVIGTSQGSAQAKVKFGVLQKDVNIYVQPPALMSLRLDPVSFTLKRGESRAYVVKANYSDGSVEDVTSEAHVESSNATIATVLGDERKVVGENQGAVNVIASYKGRTVSALVAVENPVLSYLEVRPPSITVRSGLTENFQIFGIYTDETEVDLTSIADIQVVPNSRAEVMSPGALEGRGPGKAILSAIYVEPGTGRNLSGSGALTVAAPLLNSLAFIPSSPPSLALGQQIDLYVQGNYSDLSALNVGGLVQVIADVTSPGMSYVAQISRTGTNNIRIQSVAEGQMRIVAKLDNRTVSTTVTVGPKILTSVNIVRVENDDVWTGGNILRGNPADFSAIATFSDGTQLDVTQPVTGFTTTWTPPSTTYGSFTDTMDGKKRLTTLVEGSTTLSVVVSSASQGTVSKGQSLNIYAPCAAPGKRRGLYCWFLGDAGQSCTDKCSSLGRSNHQATMFVGSVGDEDCFGIINELFRTEMKSFNSNASPQAGLGCGIFTAYGLNLGFRQSSIPTTYGASLADTRRICSCE